MKKESRLTYLELAGLIDWSLCGFCKHSRNVGGSICSEDTYVWCEHPLEVVTELWEDGCPVPNVDCWGFSPVLNVSDTADIIGIVLSQEYEPYRTAWWKDKTGQIKVAGNPGGISILAALPHIA